MIEQTEEFKVGETTYKLQELKCSDHYLFLSELGQMAGGVFNGIGIDTEIDFGKMIVGLFSGAQPEKLSSYMKRLFQKSIVMPNIEKDEKYEMHFGHNFHHMVELFNKILELNYGKATREIKKKLSQSNLLSIALAFLLQPKEENQTTKNLKQYQQDSQNTTTLNSK